MHIRRTFLTNALQQAEQDAPAVATLPNTLKSSGVAQLVEAIEGAFPVVDSIIDRYRRTDIAAPHILYTCIIDFSSDLQFFESELTKVLLNPQLIALSNHVPIVIFNNVRDETIGNFELVAMEELDHDQFPSFRRTHKIYKLLAPLLLPNVGASCWFDAKCSFRKSLLESLRTLFDLCEQEQWVGLAHHSALNYENELQRIVAFKRSKEVPAIEREVRLYQQCGIPSDIPMYETSVLFRHHGSERAQMTSYAWASVYYSGGDRDQISLPAALYLSQFHPYRDSSLIHAMIDVRGKDWAHESPEVICEACSVYSS